MFYHVLSRQFEVIGKVVWVTCTSSAVRRYNWDDAVEHLLYTVTFLETALA